MRFSTTILSLLFLLSLGTKCAAQWSIDSETNTPVCVEAGWQSPAALLADGKNGAFAVWFDDRSQDANSVYDVYAQHIFANGGRAWDRNGIKIMSGATFYMHFMLVSDHDGGFLMIYETVTLEALGEVRYIGAIRVTRTGQLAWRLNRIFPMPHPQGRFFSTISDGNGGAVIVQSFTDSADGGNIFAQHITQTGIPMWGQDGLEVAAMEGAQARPVITRGYDGDFYIAWDDDRNYGGANRYHEVYLQRINELGQLIWSAPGKRVTTRKNRHGAMDIVASPDGFITVVWPDARFVHPETPYTSDDTAAVFAQRFSGNGLSYWTENGRYVSFGEQVGPTGNGGVQSIQADTDHRSAIVVSWCTDRGNYYAQRLDADGTRAYNGGTYPRFLVHNNAHAFYRYGMAGDMNGGLLLTYIREDGNKQTLRALHVDHTGIVDWSDQPVATAPGGKDMTYGAVLPHLVSDGKGGFIAAWSDGRSDNGDVYIARMAQNGSPYPVELLSFTGRALASSVLLEWQTASENNNRGFSIQRSYDAAGWETIGFVFACNTPGHGCSYTFNDTDYGVPVERTLYYRLKQIDFDGTYTYLPTVQVESFAQDGLLRIVDMYPNPVEKDFTIRFSTGTAQPVTIAMINTLGQRVYTHTAAYGPGRHSFSPESGVLPPGVYTVLLTSPSGSASKRILVR